LQDIPGAGIKPAVVTWTLDLVGSRLVKHGAGEMSAFLLVGAPGAVIEMN
jgi:hypothetical protein